MEIFAVFLIGLTTGLSAYYGYYARLEANGQYFPTKRQALAQNVWQVVVATILFLAILVVLLTLADYEVPLFWFVAAMVVILVPKEFWNLGDYFGRRVVRDREIAYLATRTNQKPVVMD